MTTSSLDNKDYTLDLNWCQEKLTDILHKQQLKIHKLEQVIKDSSLYSLYDDHFNSNCNFDMSKLLDILRDLSYRISVLEEDNKKLFNRIQILESQETKIDLL